MTRAGPKRPSATLRGGSSVIAPRVTRIAQGWGSSVRGSAVPSDVPCTTPPASVGTARHRPGIARANSWESATISRFVWVTSATLRVPESAPRSHLRHGVAPPRTAIPTAAGGSQTRGPPPAYPTGGGDGPVRLVRSARNTPPESTRSRRQPPTTWRWPNTRSAFASLRGASDDSRGHEGQRLLS